MLSGVVTETGKKCGCFCKVEIVNNTFESIKSMASVHFDYTNLAVSSFFQIDSDIFLLICGQISSIKASCYDRLPILKPKDLA